MVTNKYEAMMVFSVTGGDDAVAALVEKFKTLITDNGTFEGVDEWGSANLHTLLTTKPRVITRFTISKALPTFPLSLTVLPRLQTAFSVQ